MAFEAIVDLSDIASGDGSLGFVIDGINPADNSGHSVAGAGDVNGDGIADLIIGAYGADPNGRSEAGESYVVFGRAAGFPTSLELSMLDGSNGFLIVGINTEDASGYSVSGASDVNGDGIDDLIIGAPFADPGGRNSAGQIYVVFGTAAGFPAGVDPAALDGSNGFVINGVGINDQTFFATEDQSGFSVSDAGDVNGDGIDDLIIGAPFAAPGGRVDAGESYVVFGSATGFAASLELSALDGSNGFTINGIDGANSLEAGDGSGYSVASAGDVNGDGVGDVIIGANQANGNAGASYVVFGSLEGFSASLDLSALDGANGFAIDGIDAGDNSGWSVSAAGDVNGDGIDDLIVGGPGSAGETHVVFGSASGFSASFDLASLDGTNGFAVVGVAAGDSSGWSVAGAGDVNGDGVDDLIIGAPGADPDGRTGAGASYVVFGSASGFAASLDLSTLDGGNGFRIEGVAGGDTSGVSVSGAGDVNDDGYDDLIVGAEGGDPAGRTNAGQVFVVYGRTTNQTEGTAAGDVLLGGTGDDRLNGYAGNDTLNGGLRADILTGGAGDDFYDNVTFADTVVELLDEGTDTVRTRAEGYTLAANAENLVLFGNLAVTASGNALANSISGTEFANELYGFDGDDRLSGNSGDDRLFGGAGDDTLIGGDGADAMLGGRGDDSYDLATAADIVIEFAGEGIDTVQTRANGYTLGANLENLTLLGRFAVTGSGNALANHIAGANPGNTLFGLGGNDLLEGLRGADTLDGGAGADRVEGGLGNDALLGGTGNDLLIGGAGRDTLAGGAGADSFAFFDADFAGLTASADTIADFSRADGDVIDLSGVDAILGTPQSDSFAFIGTAEFSGAAGELRYVQRNGFAIVQGDRNGDGLADFAMRVEQVTDLIAADFGLAPGMMATGKSEPLAPEFMF